MTRRDIVPPSRIRNLNGQQIRAEGEYVLYWMTAFRRLGWNFALQRAADYARALGRPLVVLEALRCGYPWASDRLHRFVIEGMADHARTLRDTPVAYYPYLERQPGDGKGLLEALAARACVVVGDDYPCFFLPQMLAAAAARLPVCLEAVDSNGILPLRAADKVFLRAHDFRRFLQKNLRPHLQQFPAADPLKAVPLPAGPQWLPSGILARWPRADPAQVLQRGLAELPIDHHVAPVAATGGSAAARRALSRFIAHGLASYLERNQPQSDVSSGLSPYLHFGHISAHEVFAKVTRHAGWQSGDLAEKANGSARGWWNTSEPVESFLDELITWREVGYNMCWQRPDYDQYESLPQWAQDTLRTHLKDPRPYCYGLEEFESARTHDPLWNAAQTQLLREGKIHNYLRMLWGKKILQWSPTPRDALEVMVELNNKYALDGRDPNSYSGIFWCLGRYDRAWGPERPIFGKVRYMSSDNTARKVRVREYVAKYTEDGDSRL